VLRTRDAAIRFVQAHLDLAKAEAAEIAGEVKRAAALGGVAVMCLVLLLIFLPIGLLLFLGDWLFGSIGWGLLHGTELLAGVAVVAILVALRVRGLRMAFGIALIDGIVLAVVLGANGLNTLWRAIGDAANLGDPSWRPLAVGVLVVAAIGAILGLVFGARAGGARGAIGAAIAGAIGGALVGAISAITFGRQAGAGLGVAIGLAVWPILSGVAAAQHGVDTDMLKARFWPKVTIDTAKETIEWAKARTPLGPKS
jgi:hypothetical protein